MAQGPDDNLHVCFVAPNAYGILSGREDLTHIGGAEVQQVLLGRALSARGYRVSFVTLDHGQSDGEDCDGITVYKAYGRDRGWPVVRFFHPRLSGLYGALGRANADVYYQRMAELTTGVVAAFCRRRRRKFIFASASDFDCMSGSPRLRRSRERVLFGFGLRRADRIVVQTPNQQARLRADFDLSSTVVPNCGRDYCPDWKGPDASVGFEDRSVLWLGRIAPLKRLEWLMDVAEACPEVSFDILGDGDPASAYVRGLKNRAAALTNVRFRGRVPYPKIGPFYRRALAVTCTSSREGFPNTFLEAYSHGVPVISTIDPDGRIVSKRLGFHVRTPEDMAGAVRRMCASSEEWEAFGRRARQHFEVFHGVDPVVDKLEDVIRSVCSDPGVGIPRNVRAGLLHRVRRALFTGFYAGTGRRGFTRTVQRLEQITRLERDALDRQIASRVDRLLRHAVETVPYYREVAGSLVSGAGSSSAMDVLGALPALTKAIIRREGDRLHSSRPGPGVMWNTSGGSTGEPVRLLQDRQMRYAVTINKYLYMRWLGYDYGQRHLLIWGVPQDTFGQPIGLRERIYQTIHRQMYLDCYRVTDEVLAHWIERINREKPAVIEAYADAMTDVARRVLEQNVEIHRPRGIITSAGVLTDAMHRTIAEAFRCPVLNRYGSREVGDVACTCLEGAGLHVTEPMAYVEILDDGLRPCAPGIEGDIYVTLLTNFTMPLIRYRIEDRGVWSNGACRCGRTTRRIAHVTGRVSDYLLAADDTRINGTALTTLLYDVVGIQRFQYRQTDRSSVTLAIEPIAGASEDSIRRQLAPVLARLDALLGSTDVRIEFADEIRPTRSGKYRYIVNELANRPMVEVCS